MRRPEIDAFLDDLWEFPIIDHHRWDEWEKRHPALVNTALGDPWPAGFEEFLNARGMSAKEFRSLIGDVVEIVFSSFYGAADDVSSLKFLSRVLNTAEVAGVHLPSLEVFGGSRFVDRGGWGKQLTLAERNAWRDVAE